MEQVLKAIGSVLDKIPGKVIPLWVFLSTGSLLLIPNSWIATLELKDFINDYGKYVGITFLASGVLLAIEIGAWTWKFAQGIRNKVSKENAVRSSIRILDEHEKSVLREFYFQNREIIWLPTDDSVVAGLIEQDIIAITSENGRLSKAGKLYPVRLSPLVTSQSVNFPNEPTKEKLLEVAQSRPPFMGKIEDTPGWPWWRPELVKSRYRRPFG